MYTFRFTPVISFLWRTFKLLRLIQNWSVMAFALLGFSKLIHLNVICSNWLRLLLHNKAQILVYSWLSKAVNTKRVDMTRGMENTCHNPYWQCSDATLITSCWIMSQGKYEIVFEVSTKVGRTSHQNVHQLLNENDLYQWGSYQSWTLWRSRFWSGQF